ncbi:MAG TPA: DoxX family protein [Longimicrobiaceae bacterium]|nr:DoxX family protein [Longimicrobiaceae bacterium]
MDVLRGERYRAAIVTIVRVLGGLLFMEHGAQKLFGFFGGMGGGTVPLASQMGLAGVLEFFGGLLIVLGLLTRPVALLLAAEMVIAFSQAHLPRGGFPIQNMGELPLLYLLLFLVLSGTGAGPLSVDALLGRTRTASRAAAP